ncbi:MAG TPA: hypothetical protein VHP81_11995 [Lachnospiraceae bacterium]|nr:hypothetical protein [Lachnospiraceae bacterium]
MEDSNVLAGGIETLYTIKETLLELNGYKEKVKQLEYEENDLEKLVAAKDRAIAEEIEQVLKKRKSEVGESFDNQIDKTKTQIKKIKAKRERMKNAKISERIDMETADLQEENRQYDLEAKSIFKQKGIPTFLHSNLFYALYAPNCLKDIGIILAIVIALFLVIPNFIYHILLPKEQVLYMVLIYFLIIVIFGGFYVLINIKVKEPKWDAILQVRSIRGKIRANRKQMKRIKRTIRKDKDDSNYGLEKFNQEIEEMDEKIAEITERKKEALGVFESTTKSVIVEEIRNHHREEWENLVGKHDEIYNEVKSMLDKVREMEMNLAASYETYLGKELMNLEKLESLIKIMEARQEIIVSEAIAIYKKELINT